MKIGLEYRYAQGDLLDKPNTYMYSLFSGYAFLESWKKNRLGALSSLPDPQSPPKPDGRFHPSRLFNNPGRKNLEEIIDGLNRGLGEDKELKKRLKMWVKKFEVNKRIYERYDEQFNPIDKSAYHDMEVYVRYAEMMESAYNTSRELDYLNVLLKIIDTLIARRSKLRNEQKARLAWLIQQESDHIQILASKMGVDICN